MRWSALKRWVTVDDSILDEGFRLTPDQNGQDRSFSDTAQNRPDDSKQASGSSRSGPLRRRGVRLSRGTAGMRLRRTVVRFGERHSAPKGLSRSKRRTLRSRRRIAGERPVRSVSYGELRARARRPPSGGLDAANRDGATDAPGWLSFDLAQNRETLRQMFHAPTNADLVMREFRAGSAHPVRALLAFIDGLADKQIINSHILEPLMILSRLPRDRPEDELLAVVLETLLPGNQVTECRKWSDTAMNILAGSTVLFLEGVSTALAIETKGWEHRQVGIAQTEAVVRGPHDAFTENFRANTGLVRSRLRSSSLITEIFRCGETAPTDIAVMYLSGVVNPKIVEETQRRVKAIKVDYMPDSGLLEQFLEDRPVSLIPRFLSTERPDRVAYGLSEGQVAIFVGHSPYVLLAPTLFWSLLHTGEDAYLRWPFGAFIRSIRMIALVIGVLLPSLYVAVTNYHPEMIPTDLMLAIAASREHVPFPVVVEVGMMEFSIELIREAGIRIPSVIGPTIGIVGALILGQAAVAAGIISPLLIIVVAVTALSSFAIPNYNLSFSVRLLRFGFLVVSAMFGFYGIVLGVMAILMHAVTLRSFGVPVLSPVAPRRNSSPDSIWRGFAYDMEQRPQPYWPADERRQSEASRSVESGGPGGERKSKTGKGRGDGQKE